MKNIITFFLLCLSFSYFSQEHVIVFISCKDQTTKEKIFGAKVEIQQGKERYTCFTNKEGNCEIRIEDSIVMTISVSHGYYDTIVKNVFLGKARNGKVSIEFLLVSGQVQEIKPVYAYAAGIPQVVYQSKVFSVADFELLPEGKILLLLYPKTLKKGGELAILEGDNLSHKFQMPEKPKELLHDFRGNSHVVCENGVYGIHCMDNTIGVSTLDRKYFMKYIFPIIDTNDTKLYFSNFNKNYPAFDYKIYDQMDSVYSLIREIKDEFMMELYRSEYKWVDIRTKLWAKNLELETGIDKEIWVGANYFTQSIYYKELYAPMFRKKDSIFVFDYYKDKLYSYDLEGKTLDSVAIFHHYEPKKTGWKKKIVQDQETEELYAFFEKDGICSLKKIDVRSGKLSPSIVFEHKYVDKIAVSGGLAYYIYRPYESAQKKFLYQIKLPR